MPTVIMQRVFYGECHKNIIMLNVIMLNVIMLNVVAPPTSRKYYDMGSPL
jgi:hypothetical protein